MHQRRHAYKNHLPKDSSNLKSVNGNNIAISKTTFKQFLKHSLPSYFPAVQYIRKSSIFMLMNSTNSLAVYYFNLY